MKALCQARQLTVLIITHKFREVFGFCDEVTVLRRGRRTGARRCPDHSRDEMAGWMMGVSTEESATGAATAAGAAAGRPQHCRGAGPAAQRAGSGRHAAWPSASSRWPA